MALHNSKNLKIKWENDKFQFDFVEISIQHPGRVAVEIVFSIYEMPILGNTIDVFIKVSTRNVCSSLLCSYQRKHLICGNIGNIFLQTNSLRVSHLTADIVIEKLACRELWVETERKMANRLVSYPNAEQQRDSTDFVYLFIYWDAKFVKFFQTIGSGLENSAQTMGDRHGNW